MVHVSISFPYAVLALPCLLFRTLYSPTGLEKITTKIQEEHNQKIIVTVGKGRVGVFVECRLV